MGKIKEFTKNKAFELQDNLAANARARFIQQVMDWESCDYETAYNLCTRKSDPINAQYSLGYKMSDPLYQLAMNGQVRAKQRAQAVANFEEMLEPDELYIFRTEVLTMDTRTMLKKALKRKKA